MYRRTYEWDDKNQLIKSQDDNVTVCYTYGSDGQRASKYTENSETLYTNDFWVFHVSGSVQNGAGIINKNIYLGKMLRVVTKVKEAYDAMEITERQCQYFYHSDHLGSAQLVTDNKGNEYQRIEYTPYGETWIDLKATQNDLVKLNYKFTAKELDEETGLYYYGARYLNPKYSMWISADPALSDYMAGSSAGCGGIYNHINLNLYHYGGNNPVRYTDPTGLFDFDTNTIEEGDTLSQIAKDCNTLYGTNYTAKDLQGLNSDTISDVDKIYAGNHLNLGKAEYVQKRVADYTSRATTQYSKTTIVTENPQSADSKKQGFSREINILIGIGEVVGGFGTWVGTIAGAAFFTAGTEGAGAYFAGVAVGEGLAFGAFLVGDGIARIVGTHDAPVSEDIVNAAMPIEKDIADSINDKSNKKQ